MEQNYPADYFPRQRVGSSAKSKSWYKRCIDAGISATLMSSLSDSKRTHAQEKILKNLSEGILDMADIEQTISYAKIHNESLYKELQNYPLAKPRIDLIVGESIRRRFDWVLRVINDDSITEKEKIIKDRVIQEMVDAAQEEEQDQEKLKQRLNNLNRWIRYDAQDMRERMASQILSHLYTEQRLDIKFMEGMDNAANIGKEVYAIDIINKNPILRRVDPLSIFTLRSGRSAYVEDSDIIVEDNFRPLGYILDTYGDELKPSEIDEMERGVSLDRTGGSSSQGTSNTYPVFPADMFADPTNAKDVIDFFSSTPDDAGFGGYDAYGNVRETRVVWKGMRKIGIMKFYDDNGVLQEDFVDEGYKPNKELGENVKWVWTTEWHEGVRLAEDKYVRMRTRPIQFRTMDKLGAGGSGYVGTIYPQSLLEVMKPYQYLYILIMEEVKRALSKFKGPRMELDVAKIPDNWKLEDWMYYAEEMGYIIVDSFKEGKKGVSQGKMAGSFNTTGREYNANMGDYINQLVLILQYVERQIGIISGVSDQRLGQIENRETVGGIERSVTQSSHITEKMFSIHDYTKIRALETLLDTAKFAWRNNKSKKAQYVLDDLSTEILNIDGELFSESEYGLFVSNSTDDTELMNSMKQLAHAMAQNDKMNMRDLMTILTAPSVQSMRRELEKSDDERRQSEQQQAEQQNAIAQEQIAAAERTEQLKLQFDDNQNIRDNETKLLIAQLNQNDEEPVEDDTSMDEDKLKLDQEKINLQREKQNKDFKLARDKNIEQKRHNIATEKKAKTTK
jgi:hypothetical protein